MNETLSLSVFLVYFYFSFGSLMIFGCCGLIHKFDWLIRPEPGLLHALFTDGRRRRWIFGVRNAFIVQRTTYMQVIRLAEAIQMKSNTGQQTKRTNERASNELWEYLHRKSRVWAKAIKTRSGMKCIAGERDVAGHRPSTIPKRHAKKMVFSIFL